MSDSESEEDFTVDPLELHDYYVEADSDSNEVIDAGIFGDSDVRADIEEEEYEEEEEEGSSDSESSCSIRTSREEICTKSFKKVKVTVIKGELANEHVDVIVNSTAKNLALSHGAASRALGKKAGPHLQKECNTMYPKGVDSPGELAVTGGARLSCKKVYHGYLLKKGTDGADKALQNFVTNCLNQAHTDHMTSIAFPALGTGFLSFPADGVAKLMLQCIQTFETQNPSTLLTDVRVVVYKDDRGTLRAFTDECGGSQSSRHQSSPRGLQDSVYTDTSKHDFCAATIGSLKVVLAVGRVTEQNCDCIMTTCTRKLELDKGALSKDILSAAGPALLTECKTKYPNGIKRGEIAVLGGGNLSCSHIYCGALSRFDKTESGEDPPKQVLQQLVLTCLNQAVKNKAASIAFPTLGTGYLKFPISVCANIMVAAIKSFAKTAPRSCVKTVKVVVYHHSKDLRETLKAFEQELKPFNPVPTDRNNTPTFGTRPQYAQATPPPPARNTPAFCLMKYQENNCTPAYWVNFPGSHSIRGLKVKHAANLTHILVDCDSATSRAVERVVQETWEPGKVGHGRDAAGLDNLTFTKLRVTKVQRLENVNLFEQYAIHRQNLFHKAGANAIFPKLENLPMSSGEMRTVKCLDPALENDLYPEVNECYLFHGTKTDILPAVISQGLDYRLSSEKAMFGQAVYLAESSTKADQYTDARFKRDQAEKKMLLVRTCLGNMNVMKTPVKLRKPPCTEADCGKDDCEHETRYDSVVVDGQWIFREFILYDRHQSYPEYVITYKRE